MQFFFVFPLSPRLALALSYLIENDSVKCYNECFNISNLAIISCDFDIGLCDGWRQSSLDTFNWTRHTGSDSHFTGPSGDHTSGSGEQTFMHYLYVC